ncbi:CGNR zinc finger domain-containing protein [Larsenimonas salina]|uniref:CGNR zinc finger domain-containing protein n=1 Tax=Larsenimonas salina TaxID=1295565 RepID=UPI002074AB03|nr:ABATE domain-containing protein [Larsenimonas salina]MCM5705587.1 ABATE domain-containing protein [Larsenimonas salina]
MSRSTKVLWPQRDFIAGHPALDFLNTVDDPGRSRRHNRLRDWPALMAWFEASGVLSRAWRELFETGESADRHAQILHDILTLQQLFYEHVQAHVNGAPQMRLGDALNARLSRALGRAHLGQSGECMESSEYMEWRVASMSPARWEDAIALEIEAFLRTHSLDQVRQCDGCSWFFIDHGRGRRWCRSHVCGSRHLRKRKRASPNRLEP